MQILLCLYFLQILDFLVTDLEGRLSPERYNILYSYQQDVLPWRIQETHEHEVSFLMSCSLLKSHNTFTKQLANSVVLDVCPQGFVQVGSS